MEKQYRQSMPESSNNPFLNRSVSHGRRKTLSSVALIADDDQVEAGSENYDTADEDNSIDFHEANQDVSPADSTKNTIPSEEDESDPSKNCPPKKRRRKTDSFQLESLMEEESDIDNAVNSESSTIPARKVKLLKTARELYEEGVSEMYMKIYETNDMVNENTAISNMRKYAQIFVPKDALLTDVEVQELKSDLINLLLCLMGCPRTFKHGRSSVSKAFEDASLTLDRAWIVSKEAIPLDTKAHISFNFCWFILSVVELSLAGGVNDELDTRVLVACLDICKGLMEGAGAYAGYVGAVMLLPVARATFSSLDRLTNVLKNERDMTRTYTRRSLSMLCDNFRNQIMELIESGVRDRFEETCFASMEVLQKSILKYPLITLSEESLKILNVFLNSKDASRILNALEFMWNLVEEYESNEDVVEYIKESLPSLFSFVNDQEIKAVYTSSLKLLLLSRRKKWLKDEHFEVLDSKLLEGFFSQKVSAATLRCFKAELPPNQPLIKSVAKLILMDNQNDEETAELQCQLPAISVARCADGNDFIVAIEYLEKTKEENLAHIMMEVIKEVWKAKIKTQKFGSRVGTIMKNKFQPLVEKFGNHKEIMSCLAVVWAHSGVRADSYNASMLQIFKGLAENDQDMFDLLVEEFEEMDSPEIYQPLRAWLAEIFNVLEELGNYDESNGRNLAHIRNLIESLESAEIFLARFDCKELFAYCHSLLSGLIVATDLEEVDDELVILISSVEANSVCKFSRLTKTTELCEKNFPQKPKADLVEDFQEYSKDAINSKERVLQMNHISSAVKIEVLGHLFMVLSAAPNILEDEGFDYNLICTSLTELIFHSTKVSSLSKRGEILEKICNNRGLWIDMKVTQVLLMALGSEMHNALKGLIAQAFVDYQDAQWKSCQSSIDDDAKKIAKLLQPYRVILETVFYGFADNAKAKKPLESIIDQLQKMANVLKTFIKIEEDLQKEAYIEFCNMLIDRCCDVPALLAVAAIFVADLSEELKHEFIACLHNQSNVKNGEEHIKNFEDICSCKIASKEKMSKISTSSKQNTSRHEMSTLDSTAAFQPHLASTPVLVPAVQSVTSQQSLHSIRESEETLDEVDERSD